MTAERRLLLPPTTRHHLPLHPCSAAVLRTPTSLIPWGTDPSAAAAIGKKALEVQGYPIEGLSVGGQETCVMFPTLKLAFDIGRCPHRAISQEFVFISHGHMDHIRGLPMYVASRGLYKMKPPTIFVPPPIKENVEKLFEVYRAMDKTELKHNLVSLHERSLS